VDYAISLVRRFDHAPEQGRWKRLSLALLALCLAAMLVIPARAQLAFSKNGSLVTVVPGIRDEASESWVGAAATIAPTRERWVIREEGADPYTSLRNVPSIPNEVRRHLGEETEQPYSGLRNVPPDHVIRLRTKDSPERIRSARRRIAAQRDVNVIVDMKLGWNVSEPGWAPHTSWAAMVASTLAESHAEAIPTRGTSTSGTAPEQSQSR
jgi:hypothetical protein